MSCFNFEHEGLEMEENKEQTHCAGAVAATVERRRRRRPVVLGVYCMGSQSAQQREKKHHRHRWFCHLGSTKQVHVTEREQEAFVLFWAAFVFALSGTPSHDPGIYSGGMMSLQLLQRYLVIKLQVR